MKTIHLTRATDAKPLLRQAAVDNAVVQLHAEFPNCSAYKSPCLHTLAEESGHALLLSDAAWLAARKAAANAHCDAVGACLFWLDQAMRLKDRALALAIASPVCHHIVTGKMGNTSRLATLLPE